MSVKYRREDYPILSNAEIKLYPWYRHSRPRYEPTSNVLHASLSMIPLATTWTSPVFISNNPPLSKFTLKYQVFVVITRVLCKLWSPNARPNVPYPGVLPDGWSWENPQFWTQPGIEDGSLGRFEFSCIPQAISTSLLHWAFVENSSSPTYPPILNRNPLDAWKTTTGCKGLFDFKYIQDIMSLWEREKGAVTRLESLPRKYSFSGKTRHPSQTSAWHTLQRSTASLYFIGLHPWAEAIQALGEWLRAIADARAYLAYQTAIDCSTGSRPSATNSDLQYLGCWGNDLDVEALTFLVDLNVPVYFVEDTRACGTHFPRRLEVYHDPSALLDGHKVVPSPVQFIKGTTCRPAPGDDRAWVCANRPPPATLSLQTERNAWGVGLCAGMSWSTADASSGWDMERCEGTSPIIGPPGHVVAPPNLSGPPTFINDAPTRRQERVCRKTMRATKSSRASRLAGDCVDPPTYHDITLEAPSNTPGRWENWRQCECEDKPGVHMFRVAEPPPRGYTRFYDIPKKRRIYIENVKVQNPLSGVVAPQRAPANSDPFDESSDDDDGWPCAYKSLGDDIPQGFKLQSLDFWGYRHTGRPKACSTEVWWKDRKPLQIPVQTGDNNAAPRLTDSDSDYEVPPPYGNITTQQSTLNVVPPVIPPAVVTEKYMGVNTLATQGTSQSDVQVRHHEPMVSNVRRDCSDHVKDAQHETSMGSSQLEDFKRALSLLLETHTETVAHPVVRPSAGFSDVLQEVYRHDHDDILASESSPTPGPSAQCLSDFDMADPEPQPSGSSESKAFRRTRKAPDNRPRECLNRHEPIDKQMFLLQRNRKQNIQRIETKLASTNASDKKTIKSLRKRLAREERELHNRTMTLNSKQVELNSKLNSL